MNTLENEILHAINRAGGTISFARFMELALYAPGMGYYERPKHTPGKAGDFYTSVSVGPVFGRLLAVRFAGWLQALNLPPSGPAPLCLVEAGGQDGRLAVDILSQLQNQYPHIYGTLQYWLVEPSATRQLWQKTTLAPFDGKVRWARSLKQLPDGLRGVVFSNELLDAFPVHRIGWDARQNAWFEWGVGYACGRLAWKRLDTDLNADLPDLPQALLEVLPDGFITEICPAAWRWWTEAARRLTQGCLMTVDYGLVELDFFAPARAQGTLRAYRQHRQVKEVLERPGEQDLTSHVNFSALRRAGEAAGLVTEGLLSQGEFLTGIVAEMEQANPAAWKWIPELQRQLQTLTHPEHLGQRFRVLVQRRGDGVVE